MRRLFHDHSLSLTAGAIFLTWLVLYCFWNPNTHWGNFFGNAIADWSGVVVMMLAGSYMYERGSPESPQQPPPDVPGRWFYDFIRDHSLTLFLAATLVGWIVLYVHSDVNGKWGQVVGNVTSEWVQSIGMVLLTKKLIERRRRHRRPRQLES